MNYREKQRDFEIRAKAVTVIHSGSTFNAGRNAAKRKARAEDAKRHGMKGGWKKSVRRRNQYLRNLPKAS